jgi:7-keto-8-aminopelargonate synthetase-like enzyme
MANSSNRSDKKVIHMDALNGSSFLYRSWLGKTLIDRFKPFMDYTNLMRLNGVYPFGRTMLTKVGNIVKVGNTHADEELECINFGSQDYLGLSQHDDVIKAAKDAIDSFGLHSAGSPVLSGRNRIFNNLERKIAKHVGADQSMLYISGWSACFGAVAGLISYKDAIVMDMFVHNSLDVGAKYATEKVYKFKHNNLEDLEKKLAFCRKDNDTNGLFIIIESLYSMNSDSPDLNTVLTLAEKYDAIVMLDMAHDFGSDGVNGRGLLNTIDYNSVKNRLIVLGTFSKNFGTTGGFVAGPSIIRTQLEIFSPTFTFTNSLTPIQCSIASKCMDIVFSEEGQALRSTLLQKVNFAIAEFNKRGFVTKGLPSAIIPVLIGDSRLARILARETNVRGLVTNLVEFPAVAKDASILRFQMMATMDEVNIVKAADILLESIQESQTILLDSQMNDL